MSAVTPLTSSNINAGLRELSNVTNSIGGTFIAGTGAVTVALPFYPDKVEIFNYTRYETNDDPLQMVWYRGFGAADGLLISRGTTTLTSTLEQTNGITITQTGPGFTDEHVAVSGISNVSPPVVTTSSAHGLADTDRVILTKITGDQGKALNNKKYNIDVLSTTTFALYDLNGNAIAAPGADTSSGQVNKIEYRQGFENAAATYSITFGTAIMNDDNDVFYFNAMKFNSYFDFGDFSA